MAQKVPQVAILTIGDEVLRGDTTDANKAFLGAELSSRGMAARLAVTIPDETETIITWVRQLAADYDYVFVCGGIGPTPDDLTRPAVAQAFSRKLVLREDEIKRFEQGLGVTFNPGQREMWRLPEGAELVFGDGVYCPGFRLENVYVFAGVPKIMQAMWQTVAERFSGEPRHEARFMTTTGESRWAHLMARYVAEYPELKFGSYPRMGKHWFAEVVVSGSESEVVHRVAGKLAKEIEGIVPKQGTSRD